ncbi:hypothetical protein CA13_21460 [Planctomycetes bacterium CA13]|uniref:Uncharacterized protein n=1 Tax=Novipirellula herctigrandis TaxID=2527986 RepID=A0A5C5Z0K7_9BACT|nr:hypothetical protein CA13_21460 [Planctomycetes bacterium CA13]
MIQNLSLHSVFSLLGRTAAQQAAALKAAALKAAALKAAALKAASFAVAGLCLLGTFASDVSAQRVRIGTFGGVQVRGPFVGVDVAPWGAARVRGPFGAPFPPPFLAPYPTPYPTTPFTGPGIGFSYGPYSPYYDRFAPVIPRDYVDREYGYSDDGIYPSYGDPSHRVPGYSYPEYDYPDNTPDYNYPNYSGDVIASAVPRPGPDFSADYPQWAGPVNGSGVPGEAIYPPIYPQGGMNPHVSDTTLARSAAQLVDGLAAMGDEGEGWANYLAPRKIVDWVDAGSPPSDLLASLVANYDGVVSNPELGWISTLAGFAETRHQLHLRVDSAASFYSQPSAQTPSKQTQSQPTERDDSEPSTLPAPEPDPQTNAGAHNDHEDSLPATDKTGQPTLAEPIKPADGPADGPAGKQPADKGSDTESDSQADTGI